MIRDFHGPSKMGNSINYFLADIGLSNVSMLKVIKFNNI